MFTFAWDDAINTRAPRRSILPGRCEEAVNDDPNGESLFEPVRANVIEASTSRARANQTLVCSFDGELQPAGFQSWCRPESGKETLNPYSENLG